MPVEKDRPREKRRRRRRTEEGLAVAKQRRLRSSLSNNPLLMGGGGVFWVPFYSHFSRAPSPFACASVSCQPPRWCLAAVNDLPRWGPARMHNPLLAPAGCIRRYATTNHAAWQQAARAPCRAPWNCAGIVQKRCRTFHRASAEPLCVVVPGSRVIDVRHRGVLSNLGPAPCTVLWRGKREGGR